MWSVDVHTFVDVIVRRVGEELTKLLHGLREMRKRLKVTDYIYEDEQYRTEIYMSKIRQKYKHMIMKSHI